MMRFMLIIFTINSIDIIEARLKPRLDPVLDQKSIKSGATTKFLCSVQEGTKPFQFEWKKNGHSFKSTRLPTDYRIETSEDDSTLLLTKLSLNDSGNYSCTVRNDFGYDIQHTVLIVKGLIFNHLTFAKFQ